MCTRYKVARYFARVLEFARSFLHGKREEVKKMDKLEVQYASKGMQQFVKKIVLFRVALLWFVREVLEYGIAALFAKRPHFHSKRRAAIQRDGTPGAAIKVLHFWQ